ncbi:MAG: isoleucine--tRNA ligase [Candidatus Pacearchaeota archaeon]
MEMTEEEILKFWEEKEIYKKSKEKNVKGKKFYLMDGPPYATGRIHMGTALNKILKDVAMRSQRLQGKDVFDRAGYDTHGVPIEFKVEKEIGSRTKQDIEKFGVKNFIEKCKEYATKYIGIMGEEFKNLGVWMDFGNPYLTLDREYVETIWDTLKVASEKNLLYLDKYPVHICPRCETAVSFNEIEYTKQKDTSVFVKFSLVGEKNTFLIIWTTTPWTLPANTGVMVNPNLEYQRIELSSGENWIIAKALVSKIMGELGLGFTVKDEFKGKSLIGLKYNNPLVKNLKLNLKDAYRVIPSARYVTVEDGTGLVHCAPGHGKEDYEVGREAGIDAPSPVGIDGVLMGETGKYAGKKARIVDAEIIEDLEGEGALVYKMEYVHDYPLCWRCRTPLLMTSQPQWFLRVSEIQKKILKENTKIKWTPKWMELRMKAWIEGISDWPVSRRRYWGTPLPIWACNRCDKKKVVGSIKELEKESGKKINEVHRPEIDDVKLRCSCGGEMKRVEDVLDVWFDSGVSSWAALNCSDGGEKFKEFWPADLNIEGKDQVRGWWNSQLILSEIKFGKKPFENISVHGMVLDMGKKKMSKSLGNVVAPSDIIKKYNRDYLRYYFAKISKGEDFSYQEREFSDIRKFFMTLVNSVKFIVQVEKQREKILIEDRWILSRFNSMKKEVLNSYNNFMFPDVIQKFEEFLIEDFSRTYIQIVRERGGESKKIMDKIMIEFLKLLAPIIPFLTESIWQDLIKLKLVNEESVHLSKIKKEDEIDESLESQFKVVKQVIEMGLAERDKAKVGLRWPLSKLTVYAKADFHMEQFNEILKTQLNVKKIVFSDAKETEIGISLDTELTPDLESEGFAREVSRKIQAIRKNAGLVKEDKIKVEIVSEFNDIIDGQKEFIRERIGASSILFNKSTESFDFSEKGEIKGKNFQIFLKKI